jgi:AcrR family transcriptional regulator
MFTKNDKPPERAGRTGRRPRGRPRGPTPQGEAARERLFRIAVRQIARRGYDAATLREIAAKAGVSVGLLYRYFPSKQAVVLALYDELSADFVDRARSLPAGPWRERFLFALRASLATLGAQRDTLAALVPVLVGDREQGLFAPGTAFSRQRVQQVFVSAVTGSSDPPANALCEPLGRLLYLAHLLLLLWWLLDRSRDQRATSALIALLERALPLSATALRLSAAARLIKAADALVREGLYGERTEGAAR